jgi:3-phenylpropionate/trans-cinnamate dioxygenase ferredoxin subunit
MREHDVGASDEWTEGMMKIIDMDGRSILLARSEGSIYAMDGRCSHMGFDLSKGRIDERTVECRLHHAVFDLETGKVIRNLAAKDLKTYHVSERNGRVILTL